MVVRQTRIFVPVHEPQDDWAETLLGRVIRPLVEEYDGRLDWFWFSRYGPIVGDIDDCDFACIPERYKQMAQGGRVVHHRSLRFRYALTDDLQQEFERRARLLIETHDYCISDFRAYDFIGDTGDDRFLGNENRQAGRADRRALLVTQFYMASSRLVLDALVGPGEGGRYRMETNDVRLQNPRGSSFQSIHHMYCNITRTPTDVYVFQKAGVDVIGFGTFINPPPEPPGGWDGSSAFEIWY